MAESTSASPTWRHTLAGFALAAAIAATAPFVAARAAAAEISSPHDSDKPKVCVNCHTAEIYERICDEERGYCLLAGSVDGLCLTCHVKQDCCKPGLEHLPKLHLGQKNHPTNVAVREIPPAYRPRSLPLHNGRITCRTCHLHKRERPDGYKMLRLVKITGQGVDWTALCQDCHKDR